MHGMRFRTPMEEDGIIEPLSEDAPDHSEASSDYDPSLNEPVMRSLSSSLNEHVYEYGRRYHLYREGRYPLPNDEDESDRETLKHIMMKELIGGKLHLAPLSENPQKICDLGTGFGDWAMEIAETYPSAQVVGIDLSPIQPTWVPPNLRFVVDDIEDGWIHGSDFDFIHLRFVGTMLRSVPALTETMFANLAPGGFVEFQELSPYVFSDDGTLPADHPVQRFFRLLSRVFSERYGFNICHVDSLPEILATKGFTNVQRKVYKLPIGGWPKDKQLNMLGQCFRVILCDFVTAAAAKPFPQAGIDRSETEALVREIQSMSDNRRIHAYMQVHFISAQKPPA